MIILIPMGGLGQRFQKLGYKLPKPLIKVMGKPIICWLLDSLNLSSVDLVLIPYNAELSKYRFPDFLSNRYPNVNFQFIKLDYYTQGFCYSLW